ncbi:hypothetical protein BASA81_009063 [Batrachochytrium salamandrivorans]|nr:hypothetical protein BASA81_009063 [Batrachochytrium salamandrivorans]
MSAQLKELRDYVTAKDGKGRFGPDTLSLTISHSNLKQRWIEIRFLQVETISQVKARLYKHGGTPPESQRLLLFDSQANLVCELANDHYSLAAYQVQDEFEIRIVDTDPHSASLRGALEDVSLVEKYVMDDETYEQRENTVRKFMQQKRAERPAQLPLPEGMVVGKRCEVNPGGRRGEIRFVGVVPELDAELIWAGVRLDEPVGKNDGVIKARRVFACPPKHGVFCKPENVDINGLFPERGLEESDDEI